MTDLPLLTKRMDLSLKVPSLTRTWAPPAMAKVGSAIGEEAGGETRPEGDGSEVLPKKIGKRIRGRGS